MRPAALVERSKCDHCKTRFKWQEVPEERFCNKCIQMMRRAGYKVASRAPTSQNRLTGIIPKRYQEATQETIAPAIWELYESLPDDKGMYLWGAAGVGKTWIACGLLQALWWQGWDVQRVPWDRLCLNIRSTYQKDATDSEKDYLKSLTDVDILLIEDIGTTVTVGKLESDFALRVALMVIDDRLENMKATYMTSNKSIEQISASFDERIASRIYQACEIIKIDGKDRRIRNES